MILSRRNITAEALRLYSVNRLDRHSEDSVERAQIAHELAMDLETGAVIIRQARDWDSIYRVLAVGAVILFGLGAALGAAAVMLGKGGL